MIFIANFFTQRGIEKGSNPIGVILVGILKGTFKNI